MVFKGSTPLNHSAILWNPNEFRLKPQVSGGISAYRKKLLANQVTCRSLFKSCKPIVEYQSAKKLILRNAKKIGPRINNLTKTDFGAGAQVRKGEGAVQGPVA